MDLEAAVAYISSYGNALDKARLGYLLYSERPSPETLERLFVGQREDGGWSPPWSSDYSSVDATCFHLAQAEQLGLELNTTAIAGAVEFLKHRQGGDGSWEEDASVTPLVPVWAKPGSLAARLYLTANSGFWLVFFDGESYSAHRASAYLKAHLNDRGELPTYPHGHWLAAGLWAMIRRHEEAQRVLGHLGERVRDLPVSNLAWLVITLRLAGLSGNHPLANEAILLLKSRQSEDGCWRSEDGAALDVHSTLEALRALQLCGRLRSCASDAGRRSGE